MSASAFLKHNAKIIHQLHNLGKNQYLFIMFLKGLLIKEKMYFKNLNSVAKSTIFWQNRKQKSNVFSVLRCAEWKVIDFWLFVWPRAGTFQTPLLSISNVIPPKMNANVPGYYLINPTYFTLLLFRNWEGKVFGLEGSIETTSF